jgi:single-strand DNA-binding protein
VSGEIHVNVQGWIGSEVEFKQAGPVPIASFRLGSTPRQYNKQDGVWYDKPTTWFTVECWRGLAENVKDSLTKGQPVLVTGRLKTTEWTDDAGQPRSRTVLDALSVGHDLARGKAKFAKNPPQASQQGPSLDDDMRRLVDRVEHGAEESPFLPAESEQENVRRAGGLAAVAPVPAAQAEGTAGETVEAESGGRKARRVA